MCKNEYIAYISTDVSSHHVRFAQPIRVSLLCDKDGDVTRDDFFVKESSPIIHDYMLGKQYDYQTLRGNAFPHLYAVERINRFFSKNFIKTIVGYDIVNFEWPLIISWSRDVVFNAEKKIELHDIETVVDCRVMACNLEIGFSVHRTRWMNILMLADHLDIEHDIRDSDRFSSVYHVELLPKIYKKLIELEANMRTQQEAMEVR